MAFRAAQTGHLLLSTLHTETAIAAIPSLFDLKIDPNSIAPALNAVMGQRLVRRLCRACATDYDPPAVCAGSRQRERLDSRRLSAFRLSAPLAHGRVAAAFVFVPSSLPE